MEDDIDSDASYYTATDSNDCDAMNDLEIPGFVRTFSIDGTCWIIVDPSTVFPTEHVRENAQSTICSSISVSLLKASDECRADVCSSSKQQL